MEIVEAIAAAAIPRWKWEAATERPDFATGEAVSIMTMADLLHALKWEGMMAWNPEWVAMIRPLTETDESDLEWTIWRTPVRGMLRLSGNEVDR